MAQRGMVVDFNSVEQEGLNPTHLNATHLNATQLNATQLNVCVSNKEAPTLSSKRTDMQLSLLY